MSCPSQKSKFSSYPGHTPTESLEFCKKTLVSVTQPFTRKKFNARWKNSAQEKKKNCPRKFLKFCPRNKKSYPEKKYENVSEKTLDCLRKKIKIVGEKENSAREKN